MAAAATNCSSALTGSHLHDRDREVIDSELQLLAAVRRTVAEEGGPMPDIRMIDELLEERQQSAQERTGEGMR